MSFGKHYTNQYPSQHSPTRSLTLQKPSSPKHFNANKVLSPKRESKSIGARNLSQTMPNNDPYGEKVDRTEVQELRRKVQEINYQMNKRKRCATKIQKVWRGFIARKRFRKMK